MQLGLFDTAADLVTLLGSLNQTRWVDSLARYQHKQEYVLLTLGKGKKEKHQAKQSRKQHTAYSSLFKPSLANRHI